MIILDQTLLPGEIKYLTLSKAEDIWEAIYALRVRGAPAIGVAAGYGIYIVASQLETDDMDAFVKNFKEKMGAAAKEVTMPMQSNVSERASDVTAIIVPDTPKGNVTYDRTEESITEEPDENAGTVTSINGFLCDVDGRIVGCDGITVTDGVLNIPADSRCTAIAGGAFTSLGSEVFEVYIPANIVDISDSAFDGLSELFYIEVHPDNPVYGSSNGELYRKP